MKVTVPVEGRPDMVFFTDEIVVEREGNVVRLYEGEMFDDSAIQVLSLSHDYLRLQPVGVNNVLLLGRKDDG